MAKVRDCAHCGNAYCVPPGGSPTCSDRCRFLSKISGHAPADCWPWPNVYRADGYGSFKPRHGLTMPAHRFAWVLEHGSIPDGLYVLHGCDNPPCCNVAHLSVGTQKDNIADMRAKGRAPDGDRHWTKRMPERLPHGQNHWTVCHPERVRRGESFWSAKVTAEQVIAIRAANSSGSSYSMIVKMFGVSKSIVARIVTRRTWKHV